MIEAAVKAWELNKHKIEDALKLKHPEEYKDLVKLVIQNITDDYEFNPDPERIHEINDGSYSGILLFIIGDKGYSSDEYWYVSIYYGSCSGCDTLEAIKMEGSWGEAPNEQQIKSYMTLALHIVQKLKPLDLGESV